MATIGYAFAFFGVLLALAALLYRNSQKANPDLVLFGFLAVLGFVVLGGWLVS